ENDHAIGNELPFSDVEPYSRWIDADHSVELRGRRFVRHFEAIFPERVYSLIKVVIQVHGANQRYFTSGGWQTLPNIKTCPVIRPCKLCQQEQSFVRPYIIGNDKIRSCSYPVRA